MKFIEIEGIDKAGKDTLLSYINKLTDYKYLIRVRGWLSQQVYSDLYKRDIEYKNYQPLVIFLDVEKEDWEVRCKLANEPMIDYTLNRDYFYKRLQEIDDKFIYNTTQTTVYNIAKDVIRKLEEYEELNKI